MEVRIERAERRDLAGIMRIERASFSMPWSRWAFLRDLLSRHAHLFVAKIGDEVVGYVDIWITEEEGHITNLAVSPRHRRKGIGSMLLKHALDYARSKGVKKVWLEVRRSNLAAQRLYAKFGFKAIGVRRGYYTDTGEDALLMGVDLDEDRNPLPVQGGLFDEEAGGGG
ncbi:ribosomal-protein-alanine N-acetyltransferase [Candidatus Poribacteria bacterium]|nr:MAG: ribosomal-protein-alanine N-acetyltransferase [Candidatus Poribacteria bacterium]